MINEKLIKLSSKYSEIKDQKYVDKLIKAFIAYFYLCSDESSERVNLNPICFKNDEIFKTLTEYFGIDQIEGFFSKNPLNQPFWVDLVKYIDSKQVHQSPYHLSAIYESLRTQTIRKSTGVFYSPQIPVKLICQYSLFYYLTNKLSNMKKELFSLIFENEADIIVNPDNRNTILQYLISIKILDPSCGIGIFLYEMLLLLKDLIEQLEPLDTKYQIDLLQLWGTDIDEDSIKFAKLVLIKEYFSRSPQYFKILTDLTKIDVVTQNIFTSNFILENKKNFAQKFDLIIGNPPYIRHHRLPSFIKEFTKSLTFLRELNYQYPEININWDKKADIFLFFLFNSISIIKNSGVVAFILSRSWISSNYAYSLDSLFSGIFHIDLLLEMPTERWFEADIKTHILIGHKNKLCTLEHSETDLIFVKNYAKIFIKFMKNFNEYIEEFNLKSKILPINSLTLKYFEDDNLRYRKINQIEDFFKNKSEFFPFYRIDYFYMPDVLIEILSKHSKKFSFLRNIAKVEMGSTTGANKYFYLTKKDIEEWNLPKNSLYPMTKSPKDWQTLVKIHRKRMKFFLYVKSNKKSIKSPELLKYLSYVEKKINRRPYFKNKLKNWYKVRLTTPEFLIPNMTYKRSFVSLNNEKLHCDKQFIGFTLFNHYNNEDKYVILALMNSNLGILLREIQGTKTLGLGSLKISLNEAKSLLVIDPEKLSKSIKIKLVKLVKELIRYEIPNFTNIQDNYDKYIEVQLEIDKVILHELMGYPVAYIKEILKILQFEIQCRTLKALNS